MPVFVSGAIGFFGPVVVQDLINAGQGGNIGAGRLCGRSAFFRRSSPRFLASAVRLSLNGSRYDGDLRFLLFRWQPSRNVSS